MHVQLSFLHGPIERQNWITLKKEKKWKEKNNDITFCATYVKMTLITCKFGVQPFNKSISNPFNKKIGFDPLKFKIQNMGA